MTRAMTFSTLLILTGASAAGAAAPSYAQDRQVVTVIGRAERACFLGLPVQADAPSLNFDSAGGSVFNVTRLTSAETLTTRPARITLGMDAMCNGVHRVVIASDNNGLWRQDTGESQSGFGTAVPYEAHVIWADQQHSLTADAASRGYVEDQMLVGRPAAGSLLVEFAIAPGATNAGINAPLLAGDYSDVLRLTVQPQ